MAGLIALRTLHRSPHLLRPLSTPSLLSSPITPPQTTPFLPSPSPSPSLLLPSSSSRNISGAYNFFKSAVRKEFEYERPADLSSLASSKTPTLGEGVKSFGGGVGKSMTWFNYSFFHSLMLLTGKKTHEKLILEFDDPERALNMKRDAFLLRRGYQESGLLASFFVILTFPLGTLLGLVYHMIITRTIPHCLPGFFQTNRTRLHERARRINDRSNARLEFIHTLHSFLESQDHPFEDVVPELSESLLNISLKIRNNERIMLDDIVPIMPILTSDAYRDRGLDAKEQEIYAHLLGLPTDSMLIRKGSPVFFTLANTLISTFMRDDFILHMIGVDKLSNSEVIWSCEKRGIWVDGDEELDPENPLSRTALLPFKDEQERIEEMRAALEDWLTISRTIVQFDFVASTPEDEWKEFMEEKRPLLSKTYMGALALLHG